MAKNIKKEQHEGNLYDKIFKENAEEIFIPLVESQLNIKIQSFRLFKEKMQTTLEREMDFFYEVTTQNNEIFILHLEFQTDDDPEMLYRTAEYHGMALRRKKMPIKHIVIYLGIGQPLMPSQLKIEEIFTGFEIINIHQFDTHTLLSSQIPHVVLLAVLAEYPKEQTESILRLIVKRLKITSANPSELSKFLKQLIILSRLRKIEDLTIKITEEMPITYDIETDYLYLKGIEKGIEKGLQKGIEKGIEKDKAEVVKNMILQTDFDDTKIASIVNVSITLVQNTRKKVEKSKK